jgi:hypothetical protein
MTSFVLLVRTVADSPSPLRQLAYSEGTPVLGPDIDPAGWKVHPPVSIVGTLFSTRPVEVSCTVCHFPILSLYFIRSYHVQLAIALPVRRVAQVAITL